MPDVYVRLRRKAQFCLRASGSRWVDDMRVTDIAGFRIASLAICEEETSEPQSLVSMGWGRSCRDG